MKYLLDTNVCIRAMKGDRPVTARLAQAVPNDCGVSMVSHNLKEFRRVGGLRVEDWEGA
jgi:predicted nucleic acid-binding protein